MDVDESPAKILRIEDCEVCGKNKAKYTCPRCELKTCCLDCVKIHKRELGCDGIRDRVKFKTLKNFTNIDLLNDYRLLEETARLVSRSVKLPPKSCYHPVYGTLPLGLYKLSKVASSRGVKLHFLPPTFERHRSNTTYLDNKTNTIFWKIDWVFPQAENYRITDKRVMDTSYLSACVHKYIAPDDRTFPNLSFYQAAGHSGITLLLQAERTTPNRFYMLDSTSTIRENLSGKPIVENPVIYVILNHHRQSYNVISEEEKEKELMKKQMKGQNYKRIHAASDPSNLLFSGTNEGGNIIDEKCSSGTEEPPNEVESEETERPPRNHFNFSHRGRSQGRGRGHFKGRWNGRKNRRGQRAKPQNSSGQINGDLSHSVRAITLQSQ